MDISDLISSVNFGLDPGHVQKVKILLSSTGLRSAHTSLQDLRSVIQRVPSIQNRIMAVYLMLDTAKRNKIISMARSDEDAFKESMKQAHDLKQSVKEMSQLVDNNESIRFTGKPVDPSKIK